MKYLIFLGLILFSAAAARAQIAQGGTFRLEQAVVAGGGGTSVDAVGSIYKLNGTAGQSFAGKYGYGGTYTQQSGFWNAETLRPTAAAAVISGRVRTANGRGIRNVLIILTVAGGTTRTVLSGSFGNYRFTDVAAGQTVILTATAKQFSFSQPTQILSLTAETGGIDFIAVE